MMVWVLLIWSWHYNPPIVHHTGFASEEACKGKLGQMQHAGNILRCVPVTIAPAEVHGSLLPQD
jgi:hypothetical protein